MPPRRPKGGHSSGGARPENVDIVTPDDVVTDANLVPVSDVARDEDEDTVASRDDEDEDAPVAPVRTDPPETRSILERGRSTVVTATDLVTPDVHRGPAVADRDMYDHGGERGGLRLVARAGQRIPTWYAGDIGV